MAIAAADGSSDHTEEQLADHKDGAEEPQRKTGGADEKQPVTDDDDVLLAALVPPNTVIDRRRHQKENADSRHDGAQIEEDPVELGRPAEARGQRSSQEESEQHLRAGERHTKLVQQLDQLPIRSLLRRFTHRRTDTRTTSPRNLNVSCREACPSVCAVGVWGRCR